MMHRITNSAVRYKFLPPEAREFFNSLIMNARYAVYGCFTFRDKVDETKADKTVRSLIQLQSSRYRLRENIGWIRATEYKLSGCSDYGVGLHYHFVLFSHAPICAEFLQRFWTDAVGNAACAPYDCSQDGIGYILKMVGEHQCDWDISDNLYFFQPNYHPINKHQRRALARQKVRAEKRMARMNCNDNTVNTSLRARPHSK